VYVAKIEEAIPWFMPAREALLKDIKIKPITKK
jgi:hypothetical protein